MDDGIDGGEFGFLGLCGGAGGWKNGGWVLLLLVRFGVFSIFSYFSLSNKKSASRGARFRVSLLVVCIRTYKL